jgi:TPR repeat protein
MYLKGEGVTQDTAAAFRLFEKAAAQGHTGARIKLGYMYADGLGTPKDPEAAYVWITSASLGGDARGRDLLPSLEALLSPQQISTARERAHRLLFERGEQLSAKALSQ